MSLQAIVAALETDLDGAERLVLFALANHSHPKTELIFPSIWTLAREAHVSERTCQRVLAHFRELGYISVVSAATQHRPTTYQLDIERIPKQPPISPKPRGANVSPLDKPARGDKEPQPGVTDSGPSGDTAMAPELKEGTERKNLPHPPQSEGGRMSAPNDSSELFEPGRGFSGAKPYDEMLESEFEKNFWPRWPSREGSDPRKPALMAYTRARRKHTMEAILAGLSRDLETWTASQALGSRMIPMAQTWLNQERWIGKHGATQPRTDITPEEARAIKSWSQLVPVLQRFNIDPYAFGSEPARLRREFVRKNGIDSRVLQ